MKWTRRWELECLRWVVGVASDCKEEGEISKEWKKGCNMNKDLVMEEKTVMLIWYVLTRLLHRFIWS